MQTQIAATEELAFREGDGIAVSLLWERGTERVRVVVHDVKCGRSFELDVPEGQNAMDVFRHPYAYASDLVLASPPSTR
jgi:hypothetical protein